MESVKCTVLGTPRCGKTSLIHRYVYGEWLQDERHTTAELYSLPISHVCVVGIWDTGGDALQHRNAIAPQTDVFLICFKADDATAAVLKYYEEIAPLVLKGARVVFVLCGADRELDHGADLTALQSVARVTQCSARTGEGVELLFKTAALLVLAPRFSERRSKFSFADTDVEAKHVLVRKEWPDIGSLKDYCRSYSCTSCSERIEPGEHVHRCQERDCDKTYRYCDTCQSKFGKKHPHSTYRTLLNLQVDVAWRVRYPTMSQTLLAALTLFGNQPCLGRWRGDWAWLTGADLLEEVLKITAGLNTLLGTREHVAVCSKPKIEWLLADMSILVSNMVAVPIHHVISDEDLHFITQHAEVTAVFCSAELIARFMTVAATSPRLKHVICLEDLAEEDRAELKIAPNVSLYDLQDIVSLGAHVTTVQLAPSAASDLCSIGYTSGSTGRPKGAMLDQGTMVRECAYGTPLFETLVELCWEPLSHSQRTNTYNVLLSGGRSGVFEQEFSMEVFACLRALKPNVIVGSPRLWNFVYHEYERALHELRGEGAVQSRDAEGAHSTTLHTGAATFVLQNERGTELEDSLVELFYAQYFGGRAVGLVTGGAPTSDKVMAWLRRFARCGATVFNSYGITEVGGIAVNGYIKDSVECKLADVPELGYFSTDRPYPRGEIVVRTNTMSLGYYKDEHTTANSFMNGWFHTGDIGQIEAPKVIKIIDRKKNIVKLSQGEFVSLNELELVYFKSTLVSQVCIHGDSQFPFLVAVVVPNLTALHEHFDVELSSTDLPNLESYCDRAEVKELILNDFRYLATLNKLRSFERIKHVILTPVKWSSANELLTATDKINRRAVVAKFSAQLATLFTEREPEHPISASDTLPVQIRQVIEAQIGARVPDNVRVSAALVDSIATIELVNSLALQFRVPLDHKCAIDLLVNQTMEDCVARFTEMIAALQQRASHVPDAVSHVTAEPVSLNTSAELTQLVRADTALLNKAIAWLNERAESHTAASTSDTVTVLLTGATGFLGSFLLAELYRCLPSNGQIICLIRKKALPPQHAVSAALRKYEIDSDLVREIETSRRITWLEGDLNLAFFGLTETRFHELAAQTDHVIHNAAWVNGLWPYKSLRAVNVHATIDVLKYSVLSRGKSLHYVSTASTLADQAQVWARDGGYALTKLVAEEFVRSVVEQFPSFAAAIYRPGSISGDTQHGALNMEAYINKLMAGLVQLGTFPNLSTALNWIPCDIVARNIVHESLRNIHQGSRLRAINLVNSQAMTWQEFTAHLAQSTIFGNRTPKIVRFTEWRKELAANRAQNALGPLMAYFSDGVPSDDPVECTNLAVACPSMSRDLIDKYLQYMVRQGYI